MSTPIIMLTRSLDELREEWARDTRATEKLARYDDLAEPGTRIWVYGYPECFAATVVGLSIDFVESMFAPVDTPLAEFIEPLLAATRDDTGELFQVGAVVTCTLEAAQTAWHVVDGDGLIVAGGPGISEDRAREIATRRGPGYSSRYGVPACGVEQRPDDGLGTFDPEKP